MPEYQALNAAEIERLEAAIDVWNEELGPLENFILPGGSMLIAQAHVCRSLARSAERRCQHLNALEPLAGVGLAYINRLSDLLFVMARVIARRQGLRRFFGSPRRNRLVVAYFAGPLFAGKPAKRSAAASLHNQASGQNARIPATPWAPAAQAF
jgi:hypothetical protein